MSVADPGVDLAAFARPAAPLPPPRRTPWRVLLPVALLAGFLAVFASASRDAWRGAVEVEVVRPIVRRGDDGPSTTVDAVILQAAGWAEPDPFPIYVSALTAGVVREVLVRESDAVRRGDPVVRLDDGAAARALARAEAELGRATAERARAAVEARYAAEAFGLALAVTEAAQSAEAESAGRAAESRNRASVRAAGDARVAVARAELALQEKLLAAGSTPPQSVARARASLDEAVAAAAGLESEAARAASDAAVAAARERRTAIELKTRLEDRRTRDLAVAAEKVAAEAEAVARAGRDEAQLALERTVVRASADGRVLERRVAPGSVVTSDEPTVVTLYDPTAIRVRVDVPQSDAARLGLGQRVAVATESSGSRSYQGEVVRITSKADIQKVTVQAHVRILDPDDLLRPDVLCQARFGPLPGAASRRAARAAAGDAGGDRLYLPARLVVDRAVWTLDPLAKKARRTPVTTGAADGDLVEVTSGIDVSSKVLDPGSASLSDGAAVRVRGS